MSKESLIKARERAEAEVAARNKLMKEFNLTRDPIYFYIYNEIKKTRKWVAFMGVMLILSLIGAVIAALSTV